MIKENFKEDVDFKIYNYENNEAILMYKDKLNNIYNQMLKNHLIFFIIKYLLIFHQLITMNKNILPSNKPLNVVIMTRSGKILTTMSNDNTMIKLLSTSISQSPLEKLVELENMLGGYFGFSVHDSWFVIDDIISSHYCHYHEQFLVYDASEKMMERLAAKNRDMVIYDLASIPRNMADHAFKRFIAISSFANHQIQMIK